MLLTRPWLTPAIVACWAVSMSWLVTAKIMPSLGSYAPPGHQALYATNNELVPVAWSVFWNESPVGYAVSRSEKQPDKGLTVSSLLHFNSIPLDEMIPGWLRVMASNSLPDRMTVPFSARGKLSIDPRGQLRSFRSMVRIPDVVDCIALDGTVNNGRVSVSVQAQGMRYDVQRQLPDGMIIGDELSPHASMPGLFVSRRWTVPSYSPLRPGGAPIEILHAQVTRETTFFWNDKLVRVHEVTYRDDPTAPHHKPRSTMLVDMEGRVLRQEAELFGGTLAFVRRDDESASRLVAEMVATEPDGFEMLGKNFDDQCPRPESPAADGLEASSNHVEGEALP